MEPQMESAMLCTTSCMQVRKASAQNREGNLRPGSSPGEQMAEAMIYIVHKRKEEECLKKNEERDGSTEEWSRARLTLTTNLVDLCPQPPPPRPPP